jgi:hypothetical protein
MRVKKGRPSIGKQGLFNLDKNILKYNKKYSNASNGF